MAVLFEVRTNAEIELLNVTEQVRKVVLESGVREGIACVYVPHTTAGIIIQEPDEPSADRDLLWTLEQLLPQTGYEHGDVHAIGHLKAALIGHSVCVPISGGGLSLGGWQGILLCEFGGPRTRRVVVQVVGEG